MAVKSKPFYWLVCDAPDCAAQFPDDGEGVIAYSEAEHLSISAPDSEWLLVGDKHYCWDHSFEYCRECGSELSEEERDTGEYECTDCLAEVNG